MDVYHACPVLPFGFAVRNIDARRVGYHPIIREIRYFFETRFTVFAKKQAKKLRDDEISRRSVPFFHQIGDFVPEIVADSRFELKIGDVFP